MSGPTLPEFYIYFNAFEKMNTSKMTQNQIERTGGGKKCAE